MASSDIEQVQTTSPVLEPVLSDRYALQWRHFTVCLFFSVFFVYLNYLPIWHSDIWCHVLYGEWMIDHGALPAEDPFLPLAAGMRVVDNAWGSQLFLGWIVRQGGAAALSNLFAVTMLLTYVVLARIFFRISGSLVVMSAGLLIAFLLGFTRHMVIRPEIFGNLLLALLLLLLLRIEPWSSRCVVRHEKSAPDAFPIQVWLGVPLIFVVWANTHGSFAVGLVILACHVAGRAVEVAWQQRDLAAIVQDGQFRRWTLLTELAVGATLLNPYGAELLLETARFGQNPNLRDVVEWYPLRLVDLEGIFLGVSVVALIVVLRHSRKEVRPADVLTLLALIIMMASTKRFSSWVAPIMAITIALHAGDLWKRSRFAGKTATAEEPSVPLSPSRFYLSLACLLVIWCCFAISPISHPVLGGTPRHTKQLFHASTPLAIADYLRKSGPEGLIYCPQWWGDYLVWSTNGQIEPFMTTNLHLAPPRVWTDYLAVARGAPTWERILDRYAVNTIVLHESLQPETIKLVKRSANWKLVFEDEDGVVLVRKNSDATQSTLTPKNENTLPPDDATASS